MPKLKISEFKSQIKITKITFITINESQVPYENTVKYLGMNFRWKEYIEIKRKELDMKYKKCTG